MPFYATRDDLKAGKLPWVDIDDFEFFYFNRPSATPAHNTAAAQAAGHTAIWGTAARDATVREVIPTSPKERLIVLSGEIYVEGEHIRAHLGRRDWIDVPPSGLKLTNLSSASVEVLRIAGNWKQAIRTEIFHFRPDKPCEVHYHDGDEYWFVFRGHFTLTYDGQQYQMGPGGMLAAGMGIEHGTPEPEELFEGVGFATQLEGQGRDGHLTRELHGVPTPNREEVVPA
jgi:mannose-6-phosphate isomerase-like protein (cupin superfamily)